MSECKCGGCTCGAGLQIESPEPSSSTYEAEGMNNLWKTPKMYKYTDGNIDE
jgi:hypothetical protein